MPVLNLKNITLSEGKTIKGDVYFIIKDNDQNQVYFCFQNKVKRGWTDLVNNSEKIKEVEIEFEEDEKGNKVISLYTRLEDDIII